MYAFSPTKQIWLCRAFERLSYIGDRKFLEERVYLNYLIVHFCLLCKD